MRPKRHLFSSYNNRASNSVKQFWQNIPNDNPLSQNPIFSQFGQKLSKENFEHLESLMSAKNIPIPSSVMEYFLVIQNLMQTIAAKEAGHEEELLELARSLASEIWDVPEDILKPKYKEFGDEDSGNRSGPEGDEGEPWSPSEITPEMRKEINKRLITNSLIHGGALDAMNSAHYLAKDKLDAIDPSLLDLYDRFSMLTALHYFYLPLEMISGMDEAALASQGLGFSDFKQVNENGEEATEGDQEVTYEATGSGICFPVIYQELLKSILEILSIQGYTSQEEFSEEEISTIRHYADRLTYEPELIMVGPALWRKLQDSMPVDSSKAKIMSKFFKQTPDETEKLSLDAIENPAAVSEEFSLWSTEETTQGVNSELDAQINFAHQKVREAFDYMKLTVDNDSSDYESAAQTYINAEKKYLSLIKDVYPDIYETRNKDLSQFIAEVQSSDNPSVAAPIIPEINTGQAPVEIEDEDDDLDWMYQLEKELGLGDILHGDKDEEDDNPFIPKK